MFYSLCLNKMPEHAHVLDKAVKDWCISFAAPEVCASRGIPPQAHVIGKDAAAALKLPQAAHALEHEGNALALVRPQPPCQHAVHCDWPPLHALWRLPQHQRLSSVLLGRLRAARQ